MDKKISVVIIAKNEEKRISDCLKSVAWADEIIVVDDESTDKTVEIAESFGARVLCRKMDREGKHRNWGYSQASHTWVLSIDCDERVTPELADEIRQVINTETEYVVYGIPIKNFLGKRWIKWAGYYPGYKDRLFIKGNFHYEEDAGVHPRVFYDGKTRKLKGDILHYSYANFQDLFTKFARETRIEAEKWIKDGRKMSFLRMTRKAASRFLKFYFQKGGWRGGFLGFVFSYLHALYQFISYIHYWELTHPVTETEN
jgi:glycosyltransferase involved in cell wall biosynthesis